MAYILFRKAVEFLGLHPNTLKKYADEGKIKSIKNVAGQRLFDVESYQRESAKPATICYCRVSSAKQRDDLVRQVEFMREQYPEAEIIQDMALDSTLKEKDCKHALHYDVASP